MGLAEQGGRAFDKLSIFSALNFRAEHAVRLG
jgi:hypothetical protein